MDLNEFDGTAEQLKIRYSKNRTEVKEDMGKIAELEKRIEQLEKIVNVLGNQEPPASAYKANQW